DRPETAPKGKNGAAANKKPKTVSVTVSMGVAQPSIEATDPDAVMKEADKALYKAKKAGRNRVVT
ncbi:MAG: diguanylate cyclase, partial [Rhodospirillaceae bacterium]|nr:diguanylate cyclase [Rhodospirillaceae bacterium]